MGWTFNGEMVLHNAVPSDDPRTVTDCLSLSGSKFKNPASPLLLVAK